MATKKLSSKSITKEREPEESCANGTTTTAASSDDVDDLQAVFLCNTPPQPGLELGSQTLFFFFFSINHHISPPGMPQEWLHTEKKIARGSFRDDAAGLSLAYNQICKVSVQMIL
jgi:hypothetical protein